MTTASFVSAAADTLPRRTHGTTHGFVSATRTARGGVRVRARDASVRAGKTHTVSKGEWLGSIAPKYGVTVDELKAANTKELGSGIEAGELIYPGQTLVVPTTAKVGSGSGFLIKLLIGLLVVAVVSGLYPSFRKGEASK